MNQWCEHDYGDGNGHCAGEAVDRVFSSATVSSRRRRNHRRRNPISSSRDPFDVPLELPSGLETIEKVVKQTEI